MMHGAGRAKLAAGSYNQARHVTPPLAKATSRRKAGASMFPSFRRGGAVGS
jgi:hypothetical protein